MKTKLLCALFLLVYGVNHAQFTAIPDPEFEQALITLGIDTGSPDGQVLTAAAEAQTTLDISFSPYNITDLTGIEDFINLTTLDCRGNSITSLDVSNITLLETLYCNNNVITSLTVNPNLTTLTCETNLLTTLDLSSDRALEYLSCFNNSLTSLDLSENTDLTYLQANNNDLTVLNVKNGNNNNVIDIQAIGNSNLYCVEVDSPAYSNANWINFETQVVFSPDCSTTLIPDDNFEQALIDLGYDIDGLNNSVFTFPIKNVVTLDVANKSIEDLTGIEDFEDLEELTCTDNMLTNLDVSQNSKLKRLYCNFNSLSSIDISSNTDLEHLRCTDNLLTSLDLSSNLQLVQLRCQNNAITSLDLDANVNLIQFRADDNNLSTLNIKNGNNTNFTQFNTLNNLSLTCVDVDNASYSTANWTNIDAQTQFSEDCSTLSVETHNPELFTIYPNPAKLSLNINAKTKTSYILISLTGGIIKKGSLNIGNNILDISNLNQGLYFLNLETDKAQTIKKIIKD